MIPQKQTYAIPKFSVPSLLFFTWTSSRGAFAPKNNKVSLKFKANAYCSIRIFTYLHLHITCVYSGAAARTGKQWGV